MLSISGLQFSLQPSDPGGCISPVNGSKIGKKTTTYLNMFEAAAKRSKVVGCHVMKTKISVVFEDRTCAQLRFSGKNFTDCIVYSNKALGTGKEMITTIHYDGPTNVYTISNNGVLKNSVLDFTNTNHSAVVSATKLPEQLAASQSHGILSSDKFVVVVAAYPPGICFLGPPELQTSRSQASDKSSDKNSKEDKLVVTKVLGEVTSLVQRIHAWSWVGQETKQIRILADSFTATGSAVTILTIARDGALDENFTFKTPSAVTICGVNRLGDVWCLATESNHLIGKSSYSREPTIRQPHDMHSHLGTPNCIKVTQTLIFVGLCSSYLLLFDYGLNPVTVISGTHSISTFGIGLACVPSTVMIQNLDIGLKLPYDTSEIIAVFGKSGPAVMIQLEGALTHQSLFAQIAVPEHKLQYLRAIGNSTILKSLVSQSLCDSYSRSNYCFPLKLLDIIPAAVGENEFAPMFKPLFVYLISKRSYLQAYKLANHFDDAEWFDMLHNVVRDSHSELSSLCLVGGSSSIKEDLSIVREANTRDEYSESAMSDLLARCEEESSPQLDMQTITILTRLVSLYKSPLESNKLLNKFMQQAASEGRDDEAAVLKKLVEDNSDLPRLLAA
eukprot:TRINITY_DN16652_c0_g1_i1.p1 TRINITY_DN16652_c0_g1~~TRINITY_DN16652_c0_g1_i1.p1  ORF type:complete len:615 (+),score=86.67 TRINITY_DN16652_c0_g1_i1:56-1900(+)